MAQRLIALGWFVIAVVVLNHMTPDQAQAPIGFLHYVVMANALAAIVMYLTAPRMS